MCRARARRRVRVEPARRVGRDPGIRSPATQGERAMILATTTVKDLDHFLELFGTKGADKRMSHASQGAVVYRDPVEENKVWVAFDWDEAGWTAFATDPETPGIMAE